MNECVIEEIKMKNLEENYDIVVVVLVMLAVRLRWQGRDWD